MLLRNNKAQSHPPNFYCFTADTGDSFRGWWINGSFLLIEIMIIIISLIRIMRFVIRLRFALAYEDEVPVYHWLYMVRFTNLDQTIWVWELLRHHW